MKFVKLNYFLLFILAFFLSGISVSAQLSQSSQFPGIERGVKGCENTFRFGLVAGIAWQKIDIKSTMPDTTVTNNSLDFLFGIRAIWLKNKKCKKVGIMFDLLYKRRKIDLRYAGLGDRHNQEEEISFIPVFKMRPSSSNDFGVYGKVGLKTSFILKEVLSDDNNNMEALRLPDAQNRFFAGLLFGIGYDYMASSNQRFFVELNGGWNFYNPEQILTEPSGTSLIFKRNRLSISLVVGYMFGS